MSSFCPSWGVAMMALICKKSVKTVKKFQEEAFWRCTLSNFYIQSLYLQKWFTCKNMRQRSSINGMTTLTLSLRQITPPCTDNDTSLPIHKKNTIALRNILNTHERKIIRNIFLDTNRSWKKCPSALDRMCLFIFFSI